jgi:voltage-gated sodium channel
MARVCSRIADSSRFQNFIFGVIVANAITVADEVFLGIFVVELAIRIAAYGRRPQDFLKSGWNVFDFVVIGAAFLPGVRDNVTLLRLVRLLRVVRLVSVMPDLRILVRAMARSLPPIASLGLLTLLLMYVYGMGGWILFGNEDPEQWGNIGQAILSLFQILTLENWPDFLEAGQAIHPGSWIFFVSYVLIAPFLVINVLIAIIINSVEEVHEAEKAADRAELDEEIADEQGVTVAERMREIREAIDKLELQLAEGGWRPAGAGALRAQTPHQGRTHARLASRASCHRCRRQMGRTRRC